MRLADIFSTSALLATATGMLACSPDPVAVIPQWTVFVSTDAPLPQMGNRLLVQVFDEENRIVDGGSREFGIDKCRSWPMSFSVVAPLNGAARFVRATLYRPELLGFDGLPSSKALISMTGELPPTMGDTHVALELPMACFGVVDSEDPARDAPSRSCNPSTGGLGPIPVLRLVGEVGRLAPLCSWPSDQQVECQQAAAPGDDVSTLLIPCSWAPGRPVSCRGEVPSEMKCVPGGAFLLGAPSFPVSLDDPLPERLVQLSPFALDIDEMTVGQVADLVQKKLISEEPTHREEVNGMEAATSRGACTYVGTADYRFDKHPVNCVSKGAARQICAALGKRLPTEAEWEYAAGNGALEDPYPWGTARGNACTSALVQRGRTGTISIEFDDGLDTQAEDSSCRMPADPWGPMPGGEPHDRTTTGILNLGGNVAEWVEDAFAPYDNECWHPELRLLVDPVCPKPVGASGIKLSARGGSWGMWLLHSFERNWFSGGEPGTPNKYTGFRCARSF